MMQEKYNLKETTFRNEPYVQIRKIEDQGQNSQEIYRVLNFPLKNFDNLIKGFEEYKEIALAPTLYGKAGYLHANDREDLKAISDIDSHQAVADIVSHQNSNRWSRFDLRHLKHISNRAKSLEDAGVPPIFKEGLETPHVYVDQNGVVYQRFPTTDHILNIFARSPHRVDGYAGRATIDTIRYFQNYGIRSDINEVIDRDVKDEVNRLCDFRDDASKDYVLKAVELAIGSLRYDLGSLPRETKLQGVGDEELKNPSELVSKKLWFVTYTPEAVKTIVDSYWDNFAEKEADNVFVSDPESSKIAQKFPHFFPNDLEYKIQNFADEKLKNALQNGDFKSITRGNLEKLSQKARQTLDEKIQTYFFEQVGLDELSRPIGELPIPDVLKPSYEKVMEEAQLAGVQKLSSTELLEYITKHSGSKKLGEERPLVSAEINSRLGNPNFFEDIVQAYTSQLTLQDINYKSSKEIRERTHLQTGRVRVFGTKVLDEIEKRLIDDLGEHEFISYLKEGVFPNKYRETARQILKKKTQDLVEQHKSNEKESINAIFKKLGIQKVSLALRLLTKGEQEKPKDETSWSFTPQRYRGL